MIREQDDEAVMNKTLQKIRLKLDKITRCLLDKNLCDSSLSFSGSIIECLGGKEVQQV